MFKRVAIVNRGEAAMRLIHAISELNAENADTAPDGRGGTGRIETIALHTDVDAHATYVREADHAHLIGPAAARPYLDHAALERALVETGADAAWVGWGFVAEDPAFAELCERIGVTFIGPSADAMRKLGDKIGAKLIAEEVGVPVAPWSRGPVETLDGALAAAERIGYPLMLKATAGGGGRGIRVVTSADELTYAYQRTSEEALRAFGSGVVFLERLVTGARHVEVQVIADGQGTAWALGVRDCSVQRRNQKVIEESASPVLSPAQVDELKTSAERLALAVDYCGAGTVEFLYHPGEQLFAFLEVNTRLQVEHPITELTTGIDLVKAQLHVAAGNTLPTFTRSGQKPTELGHAVEARLNAEDPDRDFAPAPGRIALLDFAAGPGIRIDTGVSTGDEIPADFDSMIAKVIAYGRDRDEALARLRRAMAETTVVIEGGTTNKSFVLSLLDEPAVISGAADTGWIDRVRGEGGLIAQKHSGVALANAAIDAYREERQAEVERLLATAHGGRPQVQHETGRPIDLKLRGIAHRLTVVEMAPDTYRVGFLAADDQVTTVDVRIERHDAHTGTIELNGRRHRLVTDTHGPVHLVEVDGITHRVSRDEGGVLRSPAPALVVATPLSAGDEVAAGAPVLVLESMKMETVLRAPFRAVLRELTVAVGSQVGTGSPLLRLEPIGDEAAEEVVEATVDLELPPSLDTADPQVRVARGLAELRSQLLGFDTDPHTGRTALADYLAARSELGQQPSAAELDLLEIFVDLAELGRNKPGDEESSDTRVHSPREYFHSYLQSLDADRLPTGFRDRLRRMLAHYGITDLDRSPELEDAVFRIFLAQQSGDTRIATALLQEWVESDPPTGPLWQQIGEALERVVAATQLRFPVVGDLARTLVFRWYAQPLLRRNRAEVYLHVRRQLQHLDAHPDAADREQRIAEMVASPEPLSRLLAQRLARPDQPEADLLEVMVRRHYRDQGLTDLQCLRGTVDGARATVTAQCLAADGEPYRLVATVGSRDELDQILAELPILTDQPTRADLYLTWPDRPTEDAVVAAQLEAALSSVRLDRITVTVVDGTGAQRQFTFTRGEDGPVEDLVLRGLHPMVARRLRLDRLRHFDLTRLPAADEDITLLRCVAPSNPSDERLVALGQVRDLTPLTDSEGEILSLPAVEGVLGAAVEAIRRSQVQRPERQRLDTNRIILYVWPPTTLTKEDLKKIAHRIVPTTTGAGVEEVVFIGRQQQGDALVDIAVRISYEVGTGVRMSITAPPTEAIEPLDEYGQKVLRARRRGTVYPYELAEMLAGPGGSFVEHDLVDGQLVPVDRPRGNNTAAIVAGVATTPTERYPEGMTRVALLGDPIKALGALSEPECARIIAALDLAERMDVPVEWYALSAGARIAMDSGTENMDWVAKALRRIVQFTQDGREINIVVAGINVGAQPYWNAEATMLMHTKGILVMTPDSAMVLTGKQSLDFSGGVSAEDNFGIGGYDRVMGPNGQAQYWAPDLRSAHDILLRHYEHSYVRPGEHGPRPAETSDPVDRDVTVFPHQVEGSEFSTVGEIFAAETNRERKKPFDIRTVLRAVSDQDRPLLERWAGMADAETAVVTDAHLGGIPVTLLGIESRSVPRTGFPPSDGPDNWTAGTLFPNSSKKAARAINAASGNRPLVVLANLSGFDGSPESMRKLQLEYGAEIGRAIVNFDGPIVFCVISRYHGGAFVVFSKALNPRMTVLAVEGSYASVLGGAPAAAVVFAGEVRKRTASDPRITELEAQVTANPRDGQLVARLGELRTSVRAEKLGEVAAEFDAVHSIQRAQQVGSVDAIIAPEELRPRIIDAVVRGLDRR